MSKQIVIDYINCNERKHLSENCENYDNIDEWIAYAKNHIYYHFLVCLENTAIADAEIKNIWEENHDDEEAHDTGFFVLEKEEKPAKVWLMTPDNKNIQSVPYDSVPYDFNIKKYFPNGFECRQYCINNIMDYYVVFFDANDGGKYNASAKWIAPHCQVASTGNFIIMRKKWFDEEEKTVEMEITPKEFRAKYLK